MHMIWHIGNDDAMFVFQLFAQNICGIGMQGTGKAVV